MNADTSPRANTLPILVGLSVVIVAVDDDGPNVLVTQHSSPASNTSSGRESYGLPFGSFDPVHHRTFELALRHWVTEQTGFELGFVEQLYTFGDRGRETGQDFAAPKAERVISVGYLAMARARTDVAGFPAVWRDWYALFPWEDWRAGRPECLKRIELALREWVSAQSAADNSTLDRVCLAFGLDGRPWIEERVLERYELLYEAGLVAEAARDHNQPFMAQVQSGSILNADHRRILATAMGRLRGKIKYRPIVFDLMPEAFTLSTLQASVEAILGLRLHKQNFRRALSASRLVEGTGSIETATGGRPAELFRFRAELLRERAVLGVPTPLSRTT
jgi:hypothetical protein